MNYYEEGEFTNFKIMKNILVSGASGIIGYGILRSLKRSGLDLRLIGTTIYTDSVAQGFCDVFEQAPPTIDPGYVDWLIKIIERHHIDLIIPGIDADMYKWADHVSEIEKIGTKVLINNTELISLCGDKWIFYQALMKNSNSYAIKSSLNSEFNFLVNEFGLPFILKARHGSGSKGIVEVDSLEKFQKHQCDIGSILMAQPIVGNDEEEYTTSAFCDGEGSFWAFMTLKRKLSKDGFTDKAEVVYLNEIKDALSALCKIFKPIGPTNFQFRMHNGALKLLEINPRISSSTSIRTAFGYNECQMAVEYFLENKSIDQPYIKNGRAVRYVEDLIIYAN
jgi:carbamoyl-phosphate synthase large subunit